MKEDQCEGRHLHFAAGSREEQRFRRLFSSSAPWVEPEDFEWSAFGNGSCLLSVIIVIYTPQVAIGLQSFFEYTHSVPQLFSLVYRWVFLNSIEVFKFKPSLSMPEECFHFSRRGVGPPARPPSSSALCFTQRATCDFWVIVSPFWAGTSSSSWTAAGLAPAHPPRSPSGSPPLLSWAPRRATRGRIRYSRVLRVFSPCWRCWWECRASWSARVLCLCGDGPVRRLRGRGRPPFSLAFPS